MIEHTAGTIEDVIRDRVTAGAEALAGSQDQWGAVVAGEYVVDVEVIASIVLAAVAEREDTLGCRLACHVEETRSIVAVLRSMAEEHDEYHNLIEDLMARIEEQPSE